MDNIGNFKIGIFSGFYPLIKGGAEYQSKIISEELKRSSKIFFISIGHAKDQIIEKDDMKIYTLKLNLLLNTLLLYYPIRAKIFRILKKENPDVIYQRVLNSFSYHLAQYAKQKCKPLFIHIADNYSLQFKFSLRGLVKKWMFTSIKRTKANFITQTQLQTTLLKDLGIMPVLQTYNIHPLISSLEQDLIKKKSFPHKIVWIGSARKVKQLEVFLQLAAQYQQNNDVQFIIIGRIDNKTYGRELKEYVKDLGNVSYLGEHNNDYVNTFLCESFVLVNTSMSEGFSNTFIQAWMRGIPVISLNSNPDNIITIHSLGYFCDGNICLLKESLDELLENKNLYAKISENCIKISALFSTKSIEPLKKILLQK